VGKVQFAERKAAGFQAVVMATGAILLYQRLLSSQVEGWNRLGGSGDSGTRETYQNYSQCHLLKPFTGNTYP
jgi:hypothetical protein